MKHGANIHKHINRIRLTVETKYLKYYLICVVKEKKYKKKSSYGI